jgi:small subunit ribosomal protein S13
MARIAGVDLPRSKRLEIALTYIYGIGRTTAREICGKAEIDAASKTDVLSEGEVVRLREIIERDHKVEGDLRREVSQNIKMLMDIQDVDGYRMLPRSASPSRIAGEGAAYTHQCADSKGSEEDCCRQEEDAGEEVKLFEEGGMS